jgi:hypothetical protein
MKAKEFNNALMFLLPNQHTPIIHIPIDFKTLKLLNMKELKNCGDQSINSTNSLGGDCIPICTTNP